MTAILRFIDYGLAALVLLAGSLQVFFAVSAMFDTLTPDAVWFFGAGIALWLAGGLNVLRIAYARQAPGVKWASFFANVLILVLAFFYGAAVGDFLQPVVIGQLALFAGAAFLSAMRTE